MKGGGYTVSFKIKGNKSTIDKFIKSLKLIQYNEKLNNNTTRLLHPITGYYTHLSNTTQKENNISYNMFTLFTGLENVNNILEDLEKAFKSAFNSK